MRRIIGIKLLKIKPSVFIYVQTFELNGGVPQGGCLSPTLFNIYYYYLVEDGGRVRRRQRLRWMDGVKVALGNRG